MGRVRRGWIAMVLAGVLAGVLAVAPRPAAAQDGGLDFADLAIGAFGIMCLYADTPEEADLAARLLGLQRLPPQRLTAHLLPGAVEGTWTMGNGGRFFILSRRLADGACLMDVFGLDPSTMDNTLNNRMAVMRGGAATVTVEEVPRAFPPPPLRARYRLTPSDGLASVVELFVERTPGIPDRPVLIGRPAPP